MTKMKKNNESHSRYSSISRTSSVYFRCSMPKLQNCLFRHKFFSIFSSIWGSSISVDQDHALWGVNCFTPARTPPSPLRKSGSSSPPSISTLHRLSGKFSLSLTVSISIFVNLAQPPFIRFTKPQHRRSFQQQVSTPNNPEAGLLLIRDPYRFCCFCVIVKLENHLYAYLFLLNKKIV